MEFNYRNDALVGRHNANSVLRRVHKAPFMGRTQYIIHEILMLDSFHGVSTFLQMK